MDYSKLTTEDLIALQAGDYGKVSDAGLKMLYGGVEKEEPKKANEVYKGIDYSDIQNDASLTPEQKAEAIRQRTKEENARLDRENALKLAKMYGGYGLNLASWALPVGGGLKAATMLAKAGKPMAARVAGAVLKNTPSLAAGGALGGLGQAMVNDATEIGDYLKSIGLGAATGVAFGKGMQLLSKGGQAVLNSEAVKKGIPKIQEVLNSVPAELSERALRKELDGQSIFKGKFNPKEINEKYNEIGQKAIEGMKDAELNANMAIRESLEGLKGSRTDTRGLIKKITDDVSDKAMGGDINPAIEEAGEEINSILYKLNPKAGSVKTVDLDNIKELLYNKLRNQYGKDSGVGKNTLKNIGRMINDELNTISPEYKAANEARKNLYEIKDLLGGMNKKTIGSKLRNVEVDASIRSGYNQAAEDLEKLVAPQYKFLDEVKDLRAREALESLYSGQYGGFGSSQGGANILRAILGTSGAFMTRKPLVLGLFSPKISGKKAIQGIGLANKTLKGLGNVYDKAIEKYLNAGRGALTSKNPATANESD